MSAFDNRSELHEESYEGASKEMNVEIICPVCWKDFKIAMIESDLQWSGKRVKCSHCGKSFFLKRAPWRAIIPRKKEVIAWDPATARLTRTATSARLGKWSKRAHGEMKKRIMRGEHQR